MFAPVLHPASANASIEPPGVAVHIAQATTHDVSPSPPLAIAVQESALATFSESGNDQAGLRESYPLETDESFLSKNIRACVFNYLDLIRGLSSNNDRMVESAFNRVAKQTRIFNQTILTKVADGSIDPEGALNLTLRAHEGLLTSTARGLQNEVNRGYQISDQSLEHFQERINDAIGIYRRTLESKYRDELAKIERQHQIKLNAVQQEILKLKTTGEVKTSSSSC